MKTDKMVINFIVSVVNILKDYGQKAIVSGLFNQS